MRYVVTGGAGFIGSNTVDELVRRGHSVLVLDDFSAGKEQNLAQSAQKIEVLRGNIVDLDTCHKACRGADYVLHLAARTSVPRSVKEPIETNRINIDGTLNMLVAARDAKVRRLIFAASSSAYGETPTLPKVETMRSEPISPYGVTKYVGEIYAGVFGRCYGLETVCLRYFNVFGPRQDPSSPYSGVLSKFCLAVNEDSQPVIFGDGEQSRDFTFIQNVVNANLLACEAADASGKVFNIGTGSRFTLNETVTLLAKISGKKLTARHDPPRAGDILHSQADINAARKFLGYDPKIGFEEGLRRTWEWYKAAHKNSPEGVQTR
ncbi:MAG TPA: SDR family oxidoreductase [Candidatus Acidoferrales bacterium]|nr:SDR family oxidoreductase [Candidatus Acidoferrales bacterium]